MPRVCTVCEHSKRQEINKLLVQGTPYRDIAGRFSLSRSSLSRHKEHLPNTLVKAKEAEEITQADSLLEQVKSLQNRVFNILTQAEEAGDLRTALGAIREARGFLEFLCKLASELQVQPKQEVIIRVHYDDCIKSGERGVERLSGGRK